MTGLWDLGFLVLGLGVWGIGSRRFWVLGLGAGKFGVHV